jgi:hypothetical protein
MANLSDRATVQDLIEEVSIAALDLLDADLSA